MSSPAPENSIPPPPSSPTNGLPPVSPPLRPIPRPPHPAPDRPPPPPPPAVSMIFANRLTREVDPPAVAKAVGGDARSADRGLGTEPRRRPGIRRAALVLRVAAVLLSMISFSVMAADRTEGWAGDSYSRYEEFRYLVAVNVIAFVYSLLHVYEGIHHKITTKYIISRQLHYYLDLSMDQIMAYLLISASSAAASQNDSWVSTFGSDKFTDKARTSITVSFFAFAVLALSSIISAYRFFRYY